MRSQQKIDTCHFAIHNWAVVYSLPSAVLNLLLGVLDKPAKKYAIASLGSGAAPRLAIIVTSP